MITTWTLFLRRFHALPKNAARGVTDNATTRRIKKMCDHEWKGTADGVECTLCGERLTVKEYLATLEKPKEDAPKRGRKAKTDE